MAQRIAHRARFPAVHGIAVHNHPYPVKVPLRLKHPLIAVVHRAIVVRNHFKFVMRIVAAADASDGFIDRLALVVAGQDDADRRLVGIVLLDFCARCSGPLEALSPVFPTAFAFGAASLGLRLGGRSRLATKSS